MGGIFKDFGIRSYTKEVCSVSGSFSPWLSISLEAWTQLNSTGDFYKFKTLLVYSAELYICTAFWFPLLGMQIFLLNQRMSHYTVLCKTKKWLLIFLGGLLWVFLLRYSQSKHLFLSLGFFQIPAEILGMLEMFTTEIEKLPFFCVFG